MGYFETMFVLDEVRDERQAQDREWGEQSHASRKPGLAGWAWLQAREQKRVNDEAVKDGHAITWDDILLEEVYEALAETDLDNRRAELIQVAAVAVAEIECIDRRAKR